MGRTFQFECPHCHYRAQVSGGADSGLHCEVQTVVCRDCRELFDVFLRARRREPVAAAAVKFSRFRRPEIPPVLLLESSFSPRRAPPRPLVWQKFKPACPVEAKHFVEPWNDPGRCPHCGNFLEKNGAPFRLWD